MPAVPAEPHTSPSTKTQASNAAAQAASTRPQGCLPELTVARHRKASTTQEGAAVVAGDGSPDLLATSRPVAAHVPGAIPARVPCSIAGSPESGCIHPLETVPANNEATRMQDPQQLLEASHSQRSQTPLVDAPEHSMGS